MVYSTMGLDSRRRSIYTTVGGLVEKRQEGVTKTLGFTGKIRLVYRFSYF